MNEEQIGVAMRLRGAASYQRDMAKSTTATTTFGSAAERAGAQAKAGAVGVDAMQKSARTGVGSLTKLRKAGEGMRSAGRTMTYGLTLPLAAAGYMSIKTAGDFERSMAQVQVATGATGKDIDMLKELAKELGAATKFSATESAAAMLELAKTGLTPAQIKAGALKAAMDLAAAGNIDLAQAATLTGTSMKSFNMQASQSKRIANALAGGANASAADVSDLALALQQGGTSAAAYGLNINESVGALSAFADNAIRGSDAGTSFKVFLSRLNPVTKKAKELMNELGLNFFDAQGNMKKLPAIADELQKKLGDMTDKERGAALGALFGTDAIRAANVFYKEGAAGINKYVHATEDQTAASRMSNAFMRGMAGTLEKTSGALENMALVVGEALAPIVTDLANGISFLAETFTSLPPGAQKTIVVIGLIVAVGGPLLIFLGSVITAATTLITVLPAVGTAFRMFYARLGPIGLAMLAVSIGAELLMSALGDSGDSMTVQQQRAKQLTEGMKRQREAVGHLVSTEQRLSKAKRRSRTATSEFKAAQGHLNAVIREYGPNSQPAIRAEQQLAQKRWSVVKATQAKKRAEREQGIAAQMAKQLIRSNLITAREEIREWKTKQWLANDTWRKETKRGATAERMNELAERGAGINKGLSKAEKKRNEILLEANSKIGPGYVKWLKRATDQLLRAGSQTKLWKEQLKGLNSMMERLNETSVQVQPTNPFESDFGLPRPQKGGGPRNKGTSSSSSGSQGASVQLMRTRGGPTPTRLNTGRQGGAGRGKRGRTPVQVNAVFKVGRRQFGEAMAMAMIDDEVND